MDTLHCNSCNHLPFVPGVELKKYYISNCGHILCSGCSFMEGGAVMKQACPVCKAACRLIEINQEVPAEIKAYFGDLNKEVDKLVKVSKFQKTQAKSFQGVMLRLYSCYKRAIEDGQKWKTEAAAKQATIVSLQEKLEQTQQELQNSIGGQSFRSGHNSTIGSDCGGGRGGTSFTLFGPPTPAPQQPLFQINTTTPANNGRSMTFGNLGYPSTGSSRGSVMSTPRNDGGGGANTTFQSGSSARSGTPGTLGHGSRVMNYPPATRETIPQQNSTTPDFAHRLRNLRFLGPKPPSPSPKY